MTYLLQQALNALQLGSIYALIALGYTMVYGILTMINFAHGDLFMVGAFLCFISVLLLKLSFVPTLLVSMLGTALLGVTIERLAYKPLRRAPRVSAIITALGVGLFLENFTLALSPYPKHIPSAIPNVTWIVGGVSISSLQIVVIALSLVLMVLLDLVVRRTMVGIGTSLGGVAGVLYGLAYPVIDPYMGIVVGWKAFISAVVGGIGNIRGAMIGGYILGAVEILVVVFLPSTYRDFVAFTMLLVLLVFRPYGILGKPAVQKV